MWLIVIGLIVALVAAAIAAKKDGRISRGERRKGSYYKKESPALVPEREGRWVSKLDEEIEVISKLDNLLASRPKNEIPEEEKPKYQDKFRLMNKSEHILYKQLQEAVPAMLVFAQVSMSQVFHIKGFTRDGYRQLGEVGRKSIDFLICRSSDTSIVAAIELNGPTHETEKQKKSDEKKRKALEEAGIPLVVLKPSELPSLMELRKILAPHVVDRRRHEEERNKRMQRNPST